MGGTDACEATLNALGGYCVACGVRAPMTGFNPASKYRGRCWQCAIDRLLAAQYAAAILECDAADAARRGDA